MKIRNFLVATVALAGLSFSAGCSKSPIDELEKIKDEVCACKDMACAEAAMKKIEKLEEPKEASEADKKRAEEIGVAMMTCAMKLQGAGAAAPAEEAPAAAEEPAAEEAPAGE